MAEHTMSAHKQKGHSVPPNVPTELRLFSKEGTIGSHLLFQLDTDTMAPPCTLLGTFVVSGPSSRTAGPDGKLFAGFSGVGDWVGFVMISAAGSLSLLFTSTSGRFLRLSGPSAEPFWDGFDN